MTNDQMREAFEALCKEHLIDDAESRFIAAVFWQASRRAAYAAGMERAAVKCDDRARGYLRTFGGGERHEAATSCADAIRAEIPKGGNE